MSQTFWGERFPLYDSPNSLKAQLAAAVTERDNVTAGWEPRIGALKQLIHDRRQAVSGAFSSWAVTLEGSELLPAAVVAEMAEARGKLAGADLGEVFKVIARINNKVADMDGLPASIGQLDLERVIRQASAIGTAE